MGVDIEITEITIIISLLKNDLDIFSSGEKGALKDGTGSKRSKKFMNNYALSSSENKLRKPLVSKREATFPGLHHSQKEMKKYNNNSVIVNSINNFRSREDVEDWNIELKHKARKGWTEWLKDFDWEYFGTFTFKNEIHPEQVGKRLNRWIIKQNERIYGKRNRQHHKGISYCWGVEYQKRGVIHFHILLVGLDDGFNVFHGMREWKKIGGGWATIYPYKESACNYISKCVSKGGQLDLYIGDRELKNKLN